MFTSPELMRLVMRKKPNVLTGLSADDKILLLGYLLSDSKYTEMKGQFVLRLFMVIKTNTYHTMCHVYVAIHNLAADSSSEFPLNVSPMLWHMNALEWMYKNINF